MTVDKRRARTWAEVRSEALSTGQITESGISKARERRLAAISAADQADDS